MTFEEYGLKGTPSTIYIDKKGNLQGITFGSQGSMKYKVEQLLRLIIRIIGLKSHIITKCELLDII